MPTAKVFLAQTIKENLFSLLWLAILFVGAGLSLMSLPFFSQPESLNLYAITCFVTLLYLPPKFWSHLVLSSLWVDLMYNVTFGCHAFMILLQYGAIFIMKEKLKDYGFLSHWVIFGASYVVIYTVIGFSPLTQSWVTLILYPFLLVGLVQVLSWCRQVNYE